MSHLDETWHHPYGEAWWWQHHAVGIFFSGRDLMASQDRGKVQRDPWQKPAPERSGPQTGAKVHLPIGQQPSAYSQDNAGVASGQVSECPWVAQSDPGLEPDLWRDLKIAVQQRSPSNLTELERICKEECEKLTKYRCSKLIASYPRRLEAAIAAKGASIKYWVKGLNTYINVIYRFFYFLYICKNV